MEAGMNQRPLPVAKKELRNGVIADGDSEQRFVKASPARSSERSAASASRPSSNSKDSSTTSQDDQIESTKAEIGEIKEENQRLKTLLSQIVRDYQSLQMHFFEILKQERPKKEADELTAPISHESEEAELVSLRLGTNSVSGAIKLEEKTNTSNKTEEGLTLGLDCKYDINNSNCGNKELASNPSQEESLEEAKEDEAVSDPISPPSKNVKNLRSGDDEAVQQTHVKKARVSVRVRCQTPTMNDGCQWRKYGQKIAKGNPCPRAYYRCTVAPACPVRKQVQRCAEDMSILITTYEGNHNHPLPMSATAMASTTSAAATMLMTGSSTSTHSGSIGAITQPISAPFPSSNNPSIAGVNHLNFSRTSTPFYLQNTTILPSPSHSTITLDLTAPPSSAAQYLKIPSCPSFSISMPSSWSNRGYISSSYQSHPQNSTASLNQNCLTDSIAKAITSNPSFQSVLHAAITSYVGASGSQSGGAGTLQHVQSHGGVSSGSSSQHGSLVVLQQPLMPMSNSKIATSQSLADSSWEHMK